MVGAYCLNHNKHSIGICYEGGLDMTGKPADTRTQEQKKKMRKLLEDLKKDYPNALIVGPNAFSNKACPCFSMDEYAGLQPLANRTTILKVPEFATIGFHEVDILLVHEFIVLHFMVKDLLNNAAEQWAALDKEKALRHLIVSLNQPLCDFLVSHFGSLFLRYIFIVVSMTE